MTICIYKDGTLYADRSGFFKRGQHQTVEMQKLSVFANKTMAMAVSGRPMRKDNPAMWQKFVKFMKAQIKISISLQSHIELDKWMTDFLGNVQIILMTRQAVYTYYSPEVRGTTDLDSSYGVFGLHDPDFPLYIGSGTVSASVAIVAGKTPKEAIYIAQITDSMGWVSSVDSVRQDSLKPY